MSNKKVAIALSGCCRQSMIQLTNEFTEYKPEKLWPVLEAHVRNGEAFRCCAHVWTPTHDKLLLKGHEYFLPTHHDGSGKFLLPSGWKKIQTKFFRMDQHIVGLADLQSRFYAMKRGVTESPKIILYRLWGEPEKAILSSIYEEVMADETAKSKKIILEPADYVNIQQCLWYYIKCLPELEQVQRKIMKMYHGNSESKA